jgi:hypothetical protein
VQVAAGHDPADCAIDLLYWCRLRNRQAPRGRAGWEIAYKRWGDAANGDDFSELAQRVLGELQAASALC